MGREPEHDLVEEGLLRQDVLAACLHVSAATVRGWMRKGLLEHIHTPGGRRTSLQAAKRMFERLRREREPARVTSTAAADRADRAAVRKLAALGILPADD